MVNKAFRGLAPVSVLVWSSCSAVGYEIADLAAEINATRNVARRSIEIGDTLQVSFPYKPEWNHQVRVGSDGRASFLLLDELSVAGTNLQELDERLTNAYVKSGAANAEYVTVDIIAPTGGEDAGDRLFVIGEVQRPGPVPVPDRALTLIDAIGAAGGHLKATANLRNTILVRRLANGEMRSWRLDADIYDWGVHPPIWLQPRDVVFVPNTAIDDVNIFVDKYIRQMIPLPVIPPP